MPNTNKLTSNNALENFIAHPESDNIPITYDQLIACGAKPPVTGATHYFEVCYGDLCAMPLGSSEMSHFYAGNGAWRTA